MTVSVNARALALNPIVGTLSEKVEAFKQIAANIGASQIAPAGWDSVQRILAGCWMADAVGVHPAIFMQGNHVANINGRLMIEPKWEFVNALLRARLPGYDFKVEQNDEHGCTLIFKADGRSPQTVSYGEEDAKRQGFAGKDTYRASPTEMYFKQAFKRGADRIGADVLMGLPPMLPFEENGEPEKPAETKSEAQVMEDAASTLATPPTPETAPLGIVAVVDGDPHELLSNLVSELWGEKLSKSDRLKRCSLIATEMAGVPVKYERADQIGPAEAHSMYEWLLEKYPDRKVWTKPASGVDDRPIETQPEGPEDVVPAPEPVRPAADLRRAELKTVAGFLAFIKRAQKTLGPGHILTKEIAPGNIWFTYLPTLEALGLEASRQVVKDEKQKTDGELLLKIALDVEERVQKAQATGGRRA